MTVFRKMSVKFKMLTTILSLIFLIAVFNFIYFPLQQKKAAIESVAVELKNMAERVAFGVAVGMESGDFKAINAALGWVKENPATLFTAVFDNDNEILADDNPGNMDIVSFMEAGSGGEVVFRDDLAYANVTIGINGENHGRLLLGVSLEKLQRQISSLRWTAFGVSALIFLLGILVSLFITHQIVKPVKQMEKVAGAIALGELDIVIDFYSEDELGSLAESFRLMQKQLRVKEKAAVAIAEGDLSVQLKPESPADSLSKAIIAIQESVITMRADLKRTIGLQLEGTLSARCEPEGLKGAYKEILTGINNALDAVINPWYQSIECLQHYADGDFKRDMPVLPGEQNLLSAAVARIKENLLALVTESQILVQAAREGQLSIRANEGRFEGKYRELLGGLNSLFESTLEPILDLEKQIKKLAEGDLTVSMSDRYKGDFAGLSSVFNQSLHSLRQTMHDILVLSGKLARATSEVSDTSRVVSDGASEQASSIEQISAAMTEFTDQVNHTSGDLEEVVKISEQAVKEVDTGNIKMKEMLRAMDDIRCSSQKIGKIITSIDEVAFQTNLLSLNAAVEAARAGIHGKGFAVVAGEVRNLAQKSAHAAHETAQIIEDSLKKIEAGVTTSTVLDESLSKVNREIARATALVRDIARTSGEQSVNVRQVSESLTQIDRITQNNTAMVEKTSGSLSDLSSLADHLKKLLAGFVLKKEPPAASAQRSGSANKKIVLN